MGSRPQLPVWFPRPGWLLFVVPQSQIPAVAARLLQEVVVRGWSDLPPVLQGEVCPISLLL